MHGLFDTPGPIAASIGAQAIKQLVEFATVQPHATAPGAPVDFDAFPKLWRKHRHVTGGALHDWAATGNADGLTARLWLRRRATPRPMRRAAWEMAAYRSRSVLVVTTCPTPSTTT